MAVVLSWSGGKDSALALRALARDGGVAALLTTVTEDYERISMHGVRRALLERQAEALGLPLVEVRIPVACPNEVYVDPRVLPASFAGRAYDARLLAELPEGVDPCGENGEFHTFVHAGPIFSAPIRCRTGDVVERDGFVFCDVLPV